MCLRLRAAHYPHTSSGYKSNHSPSHVAQNQNSTLAAKCIHMVPVFFSDPVFTISHAFVTPTWPPFGSFVLVVLPLGRFSFSIPVHWHSLVSLNVTPPEGTSRKTHLKEPSCHFLYHVAYLLCKALFTLLFSCLFMCSFICDVSSHLIARSVFALFTTISLISTIPGVK